MTNAAHLSWIIGAIQTTEVYTPDHETLYVRYASGECQTIHLFECEDESEEA